MKIETLRLQGIGLLLFNQAGELLVLKELESKPLIQKQEGMLSFPMETVEPDETPEESLLRLLEEEVGCDEIHDVERVGKFDFKYPECQVEIVVFRASTHLEFEANPSDTDVAHHGWMSPDDLAAHLHIRIEVRPIIESYSK